jgi:hypothetical protein
MRSTSTGVRKNAIKIVETAPLSSQGGSPELILAADATTDRNKERSSSVCSRDDIVYESLRHRSQSSTAISTHQKKDLLYIAIRRTRRPSSSRRVVRICFRAVGIYHGYVSQQTQVAGAIWSQKEGQDIKRGLDPPLQWGKKFRDQSVIVNTYY